MQSDVALFSLRNAQESGKDAARIAAGQSLPADLRNAKPVGRLVIDLESAVRARPGSEEDLILKDGECLIVSRVTQEVIVIAEVQSSTSHLYDAPLSRSDHIQMSGGLTSRADSDRVYVVRADGSVLAGNGRSWFSDGGQTEICPGDTIVAPLDTERVRALPLCQAVSSILANLAVSVAAIASFQ